MRFLRHVALLITLPSSVLGSDEGLMLTSNNWGTEVLASKNVWIVEYYSKMCGSCKEFTPTWDALKSSLSGEYRTARVCIDSKPGMKLAKDQGVLAKGIPAVQVRVRHRSALIRCTTMSYSLGAKSEG